MQQTRALQLSVHRIEMEVDFLERQESIISTNESLILNRLKAVEKSPKAIITEAQHNFNESLQANTNNFPEHSNPSAKTLSQPNTPSKTHFSIAVSNGNGSCEEFNHHTGLKFYNEDNKCLRAVSPQQDFQAQNFVTELCASEVKQLLRSATIYSQPQHHSYLEDISGYDEPSLYNNQDTKESKEGHYGSYIHRGKDSIAKKDINHRENWQRRPHDEQCSRTHWDLGNHYSNHNIHNDLFQMRNCHSIFQDGPTSPHSTGSFRNRINGSRSNHSLSHDQSQVTACWTEQCHEATRFISAVDEDKRSCCYTSNSKTETSSSHCSVLHSDHMHCSRVPSHLYANDTPYTILHTADSSEPVTAMFMGFHTAQDDSRQVQEFEGCLKAEIVKVEEDPGEDDCLKEVKKCYQVPAGNRAKRNQGILYRVREQWSVRGAEPGFRNMREKQIPCCMIC
ncbi:uncharacterized protein LOC114146485 [Xiphophorus couchianus]|uniref:uncharacterized protein LOC114146485 n=1 Tax=Xiphophorus couchianus TaxID=32473 RepID=UPI0010162424|nr:uncharacterized protein LOC114146485 [Xiphophorus couchianus]